MGCVSTSGPRGAVGCTGGSPAAIRSADPPSIARKLPFVEPGGPGGAQGDQERARLLPVRIVGRVQHLLGRDLPVEVEQVDRAPDRGVEEHAGRPGEVRRQPGKIGDARVRDDQLRVGVALVEPGEVVGDRRQPAPAVDQDRHPVLGRDREHGSEALVVEQEALGPRVQLDAARAAVEAAPRLLDRPLGEVEPHERDQPPLRPTGRLERAVVRGAEARVAVGLVHAEDVRPGHAVGVHDPEQLVEAALHAVDVVAEVRVHVEDLCALGKLLAQLRVPEGAERERAFVRSVHRRPL